MGVVGQSLLLRTSYTPTVVVIRSRIRFGAIIAIAVRNTCRSSTARAESSPRSAASLTRMTTHWPRPGHFKTEVIHRRGPWRSSDTVEYATFEWIDWFNTLAYRKPSLAAGDTQYRREGNTAPEKAEANFYAAL